MDLSQTLLQALGLEAEFQTLRSAHVAVPVPEGVPRTDSIDRSQVLRLQRLREAVLLGVLTVHAILDDHF